MKTIMKCAICTLTLLCVISSFTTKKDNPQTLTVGVVSGYKPFALLVNNGSYEGFDIEVAQAIARSMGKQLVIKDMSLSSLFIALQQNKIDLLISSLTITPERQKALKLIYYYGTPTRTYPTVFWKEAPNISSIEELQSLGTPTICIEPGSAQEAYIKQFDFLTLKRLTAISDIILDLKYRKSTAAFLDPEIIDVVMAQNPELVKRDIILPEAFQSPGAGIGVNKKRTELIRQIEKIVTELRQSGFIQKLENKWLTGGAQ